MSKPKNVTELSDHVLGIIDDLKNSRIGVKEAKAEISAAAVIVSANKLHLEYNSMMKTRGKIEFLECE